MATHAQIAGRLLRDAAIFFRNVAAQNATLRERLSENADVYEQVAQLVETEPLGELPVETANQVDRVTNAVRSRRTLSKTRKFSAATTKRHRCS